MKKLNCKYAIGTYEMDLLSKEDFSYVINKLSTVCKYVDTAINYNNDYLFSDIQNKTIISKIAPCQTDYFDFLLTNHLKCLKKSKIDIMLIHNNRQDYTKLIKLIENDNRIIHRGVSNFNIADLKVYKSVAGHYPEYNEIEINPEYTDCETIKFCKENNIKIIAYCILGGKYNAMRYITKYSLSYLMSYAAHYADIVILRADNKKQADAFVNIALNFDASVYKNFTPLSNNKSMTPMIYDVPIIDKFYKGIRTYRNDCYDTSNKFKIVYKIEIKDIEFEMLGDYNTYFRYLLSLDNVVYDNDLLQIYDDIYFQFYMTNVDDKLTKVNINSRKYIQILRRLYD